MKWAFFGSSEFSIYVLDELLRQNTKPNLIITTPDKPKGRKLVLTPNVVKVWAKENNIEFLDPSSIKNNLELEEILKSENFDLFLVASYGKIIPKSIFEIPKYKTLNIHPSLLPKYRGASPIQSQILNDEKEVGLSIMQIEETMDTGPIFISKKIGKIELGRKKLEEILAKEGATLFLDISPKWMKGEIVPQIQDENLATYCNKISKEDGRLEIDLNDLSKNSKDNFLKIKAYEEWPRAYFILEDKRIVITDAKLNDSKLEILKVIPEGKKEMSFSDFMRGRKQ